MKNYKKTLTNNFMTQEQINKNNPIIAEFMGRVIPDNPRYQHILNLQYHISFNWLMPVARKCKEIVKSTVDSDNFSAALDLLSLINQAALTFEIEPLYIAVTNFITWYNTVKK